MLFGHCHTLHFPKRQFLASWLSFSWFLKIPLLFGYWVWSIKRKKELLWRTSLPIAQYKGLQDGSAPQNFSNRSKLSPRSADDIKLGTLLGSTLLYVRYGCVSVHSPSCVSCLCMILFFSDVPERTSVCFRFLFFCGSYLFVFFILADIPAKVVACFPSLSFSLYLIFLCFCSLQMFLWEFWRVFCPYLSLCFLSFCSSVPAGVLACFLSPTFSVFLIFLCICFLQMFLREFGVFSAPLFLCVSYLFVLQFLAVVPVRVLAYFLSLSLSVFLIFLCFYSLQMFLREFWRVFRPSLSLCFLPQSALPQSHCTPSNMSAETNLREKILPTKVARTFFSLRNCLSHQTCGKKMQTFCLDLLFEFAVDHILLLEYEFDTKKKINWTKELSTSQTILFVVLLFGQLFPTLHFSHYTGPILCVKYVSHHQKYKIIFFLFRSQCSACALLWAKFGCMSKFKFIDP